MLRCAQHDKGSLAQHTKEASPSMRKLDAFDLGLPDEFVDLESEADVEAVGEDPFGELLWVDQAMFRGTGALGVFAESGREDGVADADGHQVVADEFAGELVVVAVGDDELHFVTLGESLQILGSEGAAFAGGGTLHVDDLVNLGRNILEGALAAGFEQHRVSQRKKALHEGNDFALVQHRFATGEFDEAAFGREAADFGFDFFGSHGVSTLEGVLAVTPCASEVANRGAHEDARESREGGFTLERFVEFDDLHNKS